MHGTTSKYEAEKLWGPLPYNELGASVAKYRRMASGAGGVMEMDRAMRRAYADAVEKAIRAKHRVLHTRSTPPTTPGWYVPPSITRLLRFQDPPQGLYGEPEWKGNGYNNWEVRAKAVYKQAMAEKAARL